MWRGWGIAEGGIRVDGRRADGGYWEVWHGGFSV